MAPATGHQEAEGDSPLSSTQSGQGVEHGKADAEQAPTIPLRARVPESSADARLRSNDAIHQQLLSLSPTELCRALGKVETRIAILTLCGLPNEVTEAALAVLPRAQAKKVRVKMNSLGSLHLREIDDAKEKVARAALAQDAPASIEVPIAA